MYTQKETHFFLGANSPAGFHSLYSELVDPYTDDTLYILKGGPGCGKSSFMKKIAQELLEAGIGVEFIHCSGDPDSLDAIYIPSLKIGYVDGTAPHVMEPQYPGVMEQYVNLGEFYDTDALKEHKAEIIEINRGYKALYRRSYDCILAASGVIREISNYIVDDEIYAAVKKRTKGIISRQISKRQDGPGKVTRRFLTALTCKGYICRYDTISNLAETVYHLDNCLGLAHYMLTDILEATQDAGHDCIACPSPMSPDHLEHLIIPSLSLAFVSSDYLTKYDGPAYRHIRLDSMAENERMRAYKARIRFSKKIYGILIEEAVKTLAEGKALHDELERLYNPHVDFTGVYNLADEHMGRLLHSPKAVALK